jgi:hypothetical protein
LALFEVIDALFGRDPEEEQRERVVFNVIGHSTNLGYDF